MSARENGTKINGNDTAVWGEACDALLADPPRAVEKAQAKAKQEWVEPTPLPEGLSPVDALDTNFLPERLLLGWKIFPSECNVRPIISALRPELGLVPFLVARSALRRRNTQIGLRSQICGRVSWGAPAS